MEKTWTQSQVDAMTNEARALEGQTDEQVAEGRAAIERKYGLSAGALSKPNPSTATLAEVEKERIYQQHYEATREEVEGMTMDQYAVWSKLGVHFKKPLEEIRRDEEAEERDRAQSAENEKMEKMTMPEYVAYQKERERKAQEEKEAVTRLVREEQQGKLNALRRKNPEDMTMEEYAAYAAQRDAKN